MLKKQHECHVFTFWGCWLGVDVPIGLVMLYDLFIHQTYLENAALFSPYVYGLSFIVIILASVGPYFAQHWYSVKPSQETRTNIFLYVIGFLTCALVGVIIVETGGVLRSLFAFYLIYLPSIVAIAFTEDKYRYRYGLMIVAATSAIMIFVGLRWEVLSTAYMDFYGSSIFKIGRFFIALIQLAAIVLVERKSKTT